MLSMQICYPLEVQNGLKNWEHPSRLQALMVGRACTADVLTCLRSLVDMLNSYLESISSLQGIHTDLPQF